MNLLDFILLGIILVFGLWGFKDGFISAIGGIIGVVVGVVLAGKFFLVVGQFLGGTSFANIIAFFLIFSITIWLVSLVFWVFSKIFKVLSILPLVGSFNSVLGLLLGLLQGILITTVAIYFLNKYPLNPWFVESIQASVVSDVLLTLSVIFVPLLPDSIRILKGIV